ncbi:MAG: ORF6N domain-containing protein [Chitinophagaceae bacterium]|nr:ORF6N domain-containing protein [Chitinophagaceae bacterium]
MQLQLIQNRIYEVRGEKVMLDFDLAELYKVETRVFNQAVKRNIDSFPKDFMFRLTAKEWQNILSQSVMSVSLSKDKNDSALRSQNVISSSKASLTSQNVISSWGGRRKLPYAFTEHGVTMLSSVLKSPKARKMNIAVVRAFIALRKLVLQKDELADLFKQLKERIDEHDIQLGNIYDSIENLLDEKSNSKVWGERERIGFKK